jgi:hypothetical protein
MKNRRPYYGARQRQKISLRTIVFVGTFCLSFVATGLTIFISLTRVQQSMAQAASEFTIEDQIFVTDKSLPVTIAKEHPIFGPQTQFMRKAKTVNSTETNLSE